MSTPASTPSDAVSVNWALTAGNTYYLLQTGGVNGLFGTFGFTLPSDADIAIATTFNGDGGLNSIAAAIAGSDVGGYWGDFNNITTASATTPLPAALPLFATGLGGLGLLGWRRKRKLVSRSLIKTSNLILENHREAVFVSVQSAAVQMVAIGTKRTIAASQ